MHAFCHSWRHGNEVKRCDKNRHNNGKDGHDRATNDDESIVGVLDIYPDVQVNC